MAKIVVECADPNDPKAVEAAIEEMTGKCNITYFKQAEKMKKAGSASSDRDAARKISKDSGESEEAVRQRIMKGREQVVQGEPLNQTQQDQKFILNQARQIKTERREERVKTREQQKEEIIQESPPLQGEKYKLILGEFQETEIEAGSIDAIITDPPYGFDYLPLYRDLSEYASRVLKPNGPCIVMTGQSWLEIALKQLSSNLNYIWTLAYLSPGKSTQVFSRKIKSNWKPVIFLVNGTNECEHVGDWINSGQYDKQYHDWGQTEEGMAQLIERFTIKGDTVLDPFCGAGTTGMAALKLDRHFIGIDIDEYSIKQSGKRIEDARGTLWNP